MPNRWTEFVKKWASDNDMSYGCALSKPECKNEYREKYGNRKNLTKKKEKEIMGLEDYDAPDEELIIVNKKTKPKKKKPIKFEKLDVAEPPSEVVDKKVFQKLDVAEPENKVIKKNIEIKKKRKPTSESKERFMMTSEDLLSKLRQPPSKEIKERFKMSGEDILSKDLQQYSNVESSKKKVLDELNKKNKIAKLKANKVEIPKLKKKPIPLILEEDTDEETTPQKKKRGRPKKYATKEEAYKAKLAQNLSYYYDKK